MSLMDAAEQKAGRRVDDVGRQGGRERQPRGALSELPGTDSGLQADPQMSVSTPSITFSTPRGAVTLNALTLAVYGIVLADLLLVYIALRV